MHKIIEFSTEGIGSPNLILEQKDQVIQFRIREEFVTINKEELKNLAYELEGVINFLE